MTLPSLHDSRHGGQQVRASFNHTDNSAQRPLYFHRSNASMSWTASVMRPSFLASVATSISAAVSMTRTATAAFHNTRSVSMLVETASERQHRDLFAHIQHRRPRQNTNDWRRRRDAATAGLSMFILLVYTGEAYGMRDSHWRVKTMEGLSVCASSMRRNNCFS